MNKVCPGWGSGNFRWTCRGAKRGAEVLHGGANLGLARILRDVDSLIGWSDESDDTPLEEVNPPCN